jgi:isorenieratene synthase
VSSPPAANARTFPQPLADGAPALNESFRVAVLGGGIAGIAAATVLAERGARVTLIEREPWLGGRAAAWTDRLSDGTPFEMERGFHAFFRQYYNLRSLLRRIDPDLSRLVELEDYPILGAEGLAQSFAGLPRRTPWNIAALTFRTPSLRLRDLRHVNVGRAVQMLAYDPQRNYERWDHVSAAEYLDSLNFPDDARRLLFDVFAHSFFNPETEMSAGELLMMFHFYFTGNPEGLVFDVVDAPFSTALWHPFAAHLRDAGVDIRLSTAVERIRHEDDESWTVELDTESIECDGVISALNVPGLQRIVDHSGSLGTAAWREEVASLELTDPFVVWRLWLDRPVESDREPFAGTTGVGLLDNISLYHLFEDESRAWAERTGGSIVELHAYAVDPGLSEDEIRRDLLEGMHVFYPETRNARVLEERYLLRRDCPAFRLGSDASRPGVSTPIETLALAGDFVRLPFPSALMERAAASGFMAANSLLATRGVRPEAVYTVPPRGLFAGVGR